MLRFSQNSLLLFLPFNFTDLFFLAESDCVDYAGLYAILAILYSGFKSRYFYSKNIRVSLTG
nr:MAG TPA: hypothetical protein [Caudoviricetes sp.]